MAHETIPVSTGADGFTTVEAGSFRFIAASFPAGQTIPPHTHDRPCVAVMLAGSFALGFGNGLTHNCGAGTISVEPAGETHCNCMGTAGARVLALQPDPGDESLWRWGRPVLDSVAHLRHPGLTQLARRMEAEIGSPDGATPLALEGLALELLAGLLP
jgi:AraC family transcriptional regulator